MQICQIFKGFITFGPNEKKKKLKEYLGKLYELLLHK